MRRTHGRTARLVAESGKRQAGGEVRGTGTQGLNRWNERRGFGQSAENLLVKYEDGLLIFFRVAPWSGGETLARRMGKLTKHIKEKKGIGETMLFQRRNTERLPFETMFGGMTEWKGWGGGGGGGVVGGGGAGFYYRCHGEVMQLPLRC